MTPAEFTMWIDYHVEAFPPLARWLAESPGTLPHWERAFADVTLAGAKLATDAMLSGSIDTGGYSDHPKNIRKWCRTVLGSGTEERPQYVDGERTYRCPDCSDGGTRLVISPHSQRAIRAGAENHHWTTCAVACRCERGDRWRDGVKCSPGKSDRKLPVFDAARMFSVATQHPTEPERVAYLEWLATFTSQRQLFSSEGATQ